MDYSRITIFIGNYGSGKTEISINYSIMLAKMRKRVLLVDLDVVNPYFRSREKAELLSQKGIEVIYPKQLGNADLPIISAEVYKLIQGTNYCGVIDAGGDEEGALALSSIAPFIKETDYELNMVVNTYRFNTNSVEGILKTKERIEQRCRLKISNLICNVNLGSETTIKIIKNGYPLIKKAAEIINLPIKFLVITKNLTPLPSDFMLKEEIFPIDLYMNPPWVRK